MIQSYKNHEVLGTKDLVLLLSLMHKVTRILCPFAAFALSLPDNLTIFLLPTKL